MALVSIAEAARLCGKDRKTLYRDIKSGKLSATPNATGQGSQADTSELMRVYGPFATPATCGESVAKGQTTHPESETELRVKLASAEAKIEQLEERLKEKNQHIDDIRNTVRLLEHKPTKPWWKIF